MPDEGAPTSYEVLEAGTEVYASDGTSVGRVEHVRADLDADIFDGLDISTASGRRFVIAEQVTAIHERGVDLSLDPDAVAALPEPDPAPPSYGTDPAAEAGSIGQLLGRVAGRLGGSRGWRRRG